MGAGRSLQHEDVLKKKKNLLPSEKKQRKGLWLLGGVSPSELDFFFFLAYFVAPQCHTQ